MKKRLCLMMAFFMLINSGIIAYSEVSATDNIQDNIIDENTVDLNGTDESAFFSSNKESMYNNVTEEFFVDTESIEEGLATEIKLRKFQWYHLSCYIKINDIGTKKFAVAPYFEYNDAGEVKKAELFNKVDLTNNERVLVSGYFQAPELSAAPSESTIENLYLNGTLSFVPICVDDTDATADFEVDSFTLEPIEGTMDSIFENGLKYWDYNGNTEQILFNSEREGVLDIELAGSFPPVGYVTKFIPLGNKCQSAIQKVAMDSGVDYEISAWFKGENVQTNDNVFLVLKRNADSMGSFGSNTTVLGKVDVSDGKWHRIKATVNFPVDNARASGDAEVSLYLANGARYTGTAPGRNIVVAQCEIKKSTNLIKQPYFAEAANTMYSTDYSASANVDLSAWKYDGELTVAYDAKKSFDGAKQYAIHTYNNSDELQTVYQTINTEAKDYTTSVWVRLGEDYPTDTAIGYIYMDDMLVSKEYEVRKDKWTKISVNSLTTASGEHSVGFIIGNDTDEEFKTAGEGSVMFSDFLFEENNDTPINVKSINVSGDFKAGEMSPEIYVNADSLKICDAEYDYLIYDDKGKEFVSVEKGTISFKSGNKLPQIYIAGEWAEKKIKVRVSLYNSKGQSGNEYSTGEYIVKSISAEVNEDEIPFNQIFANNIENGTFEQGLDGWEPTGQAEISWNKEHTTQNSVGSMLISQKETTNDAAECDFKIRRYRTYKFSADVKLKENYSGTTKIQALVEFDNNGVKQSANVGNVIVSDTNWHTIEADFSLSQTLDELEGVIKSQDAYRDAKLIFKATRGKNIDDEKNLSEFYIDNVFLEDVQETETPVFSGNYNGWEARSTVAMTDLDIAKEGLTSLVEKGEFPNTAKCLAVTSTVDGFLDTPMQTFYMDAGTYYELSAWVKAKDAKDGDKIDFILDRTGSIGSYSAHGRTDLSDGKWHHVKAVISFPTNDENYKGDSKVFMRFTMGNSDVFNKATTPESRTIYLAFCKIKKLDNVITNPYFIQGGTGWYGDDYYGNANTSGYGADGNFVCVNDSRESFDGATFYGKMQIANADKQSVYYNAKLTNGMCYIFSTWVKATDVDDESLKAVIYIDDKANIIHTQDIVKDEWVKLESDQFVYSGDSSNKKLGIYLLSSDGEAVESGNLLFENFKLESVTDTIPEISVSFGQSFGGDKNNVVVVNKENDISMGYRISYILSDSNGSVNNGKIISTTQTNIEADIPTLYCNLGWEGKWVCASVTPVSRFGVFGETVYSDWVQIEKGLIVTATSDSEAVNNKLSVSAEVESRFSEDVVANIIFVYSDADGEVKDICVEKIQLKAGDTVVKEGTLDVDENYKDGNITVYIWQGTQSGLMKFAPLSKEIKIK